MRGAVVADAGKCWWAQRSRPRTPTLLGGGRIRTTSTTWCAATARATLRDQWPGGRLDWAPVAESDPEQRRLLQRFITAHEQADPEALIAILRQDVRLAISPQVGEWRGRQDVADALRGGMNSLGRWRLLPIWANGQPGAAGYLRRPGQTVFSPFVLTVLSLDHGAVTGISAFEQPSMFPAFDLPAGL